MYISAWISRWQYNTWRSVNVSRKCCPVVKLSLGVGAIFGIAVDIANFGGDVKLLLCVAYWIYLIHIQLGYLGLWEIDARDSLIVSMLLLLLFKSSQWDVCTERSCSAKENVWRLFTSLCCPERCSGVNRLSHPDWVKLCVELNYAPNQNAKVPSATLH